MTYNMRRVQQKMAQYPNFKILSHTVSPEYDTPDVLLEYAKKMEADLSNWNFVTGNRADIYSIANDYFVNVMEDSSAPGGFLHSEYFVLVDKERIRARDDDNGNIIGVYDGTDDYEVGLLIDDIKVLMAEYNLAKKNKDEPKDKFYIPLIITLSVIIPLAVAGLMLLPDDLRLSFGGADLRSLPFHAVLNGSTAVLLFVGFVWIKNKKLPYIEFLCLVHLFYQQYF